MCAWNGRHFDVRAMVIDLDAELLIGLMNVQC